MPEHLVIAHAALLLAPLAGCLAIAYAALPTARGRLAWPLLGLCGLALTLVLWAAGPGKTLLTRLEQTATPAEVEAARAHAHGSDSLAVAVAALLVVAGVAVWRLRRAGRAGGVAPARGPAPQDEATPATDTAPTRQPILATLAALSGLAVLVTTWLVLHGALEAVNASHTTWR